MSNEKIKAMITPAYPIDWEKIDQSALGEGIEESLRLAKERVQKIEAIAIEDVTYDNFMDALEYADDELGHIWGLTHHLSSVDDNETIRKTIEKYIPAVLEFSDYVGQSVALYERTKALAQSDEFKSLSDIKKRNVIESLKSFERSGASLPDDKKRILQGINREISLLQNKYGENTLDATNDWEMLFDESAKETDLKQLPAAELEIAAASAKSVGKEGYRFTLQAPSRIALLTYCSNPNKREEIWRAYNNLCASGKHNNLPLVVKILKLRQQKAKLLGFSTFAAYKVENRMLNTPQHIQSFLDELFEKARPLALEDFKMVQDFKASLAETTGDNKPLEPWDRGYYDEKLMEERLGISTEALRPYFEFNASLQSLFSLCETIYGVRFEKRPQHKSWHESVDYYEMFDKASGRLMSGFYTDFFPRKQKRQGAWMNELLTGAPQEDGSLSPHIGYIGGNFIPPTQATPALLSHDELTTLFHEFGHLLHLMMTTVEIPSMAGTNVARDFVELPSQLMENYCFDKDFLKTFAKHYKTGELISDEMIEKLQKTKNFMEGLGCDRQLNFGCMDIYLHTTPAEEFGEENIETKVKEEALARFKLPYPTDARPNLTTFGHLFDGGYAVGYYSYKWSEILEADIWEKFEEDGITNPQTGQLWREKILSQGDSKEPMELFKDYRGREPSLEPYINRLTGQKS